MPISRRYTPAWAPGEAGFLALDYSYVIPPGVGITSGTVHFFQNLAVPVAADADFFIGSVQILGRVLFCDLIGGVEGRDYQVLWTATDTNAFFYPRTVLLSCAPTS